MTVANSMRFSSTDRQQVVGFLDKHFNARFEMLPESRYQKLLVDMNTGTPVVIFGGTGTYHGLQKDLMDILQIFCNTKEHGYIIVVEKKADSMYVFAGPLGDFVGEKDELVRNRDDDYQFHYKRKGDKIFISESGLALNLIGKA